MRPLQTIAMGVVFLALGPAGAEPGTFDPVPDPVGWLFLLLGLWGLTPVLDPDRVPTLRVVGVLALAISVALVVPAADRWVATDPALGWSADVPRFAFLALLSHQLSGSARRARHTSGATSFALTTLTLLFVLAAPPLAFGAGWDGVGTAGEAAAQAVQLALIVLCFVFGGQAWAGAREREPRRRPDPAD